MSFQRIIIYIILIYSGGDRGWVVAHLRFRKNLGVVCTVAPPLDIYNVTFCHVHDRIKINVGFSHTYLTTTNVKLQQPIA
jgi:hypothetical protein